MSVQWEVQKRRDCDGTVTRYLSGMCGEHLIKRTDPTNIKSFEQHYTLVIPFTLPQTTTPGPCQYNTHSNSNAILSTTSFQLNWN